MHKLGSSPIGCEDFSTPGGITNGVSVWGLRLARIYRSQFRSGMPSFQTICAEVRETQLGPDRGLFAANHHS